LGFGVLGLSFRVWGFGFRVEIFRVLDFRVLGSRLGGLGFRFSGFGFRGSGFEPFNIPRLARARH